MAKFLSVVSETELNQPMAQASTLSPEQLAYNQLRAQLDGADAIRGDASANTFTDVSPEVNAKTTAMRTKLAQMAAALTAKGIDAEAEYDAPDPAVPASEPVNINQKYSENIGMSRLLSIISEGKDTKTNRLSTAEQIAVQHYVEPETKVTTNPVLNKPQNEHLIKKYVDMVLAERAEELEAQKTAIKERAARVVQSMREGVKVTKVDPAAKTVTYSDDTSNVTTTVPQTMVRPGDGGKLAVDKNAAVPGGIDQQGSEIKPGMDVEISELSPELRSRYAHKARLKQAGAGMQKFFNRDNPDEVAKADREIAKREKGLGMVKTRTDKWVASQKEKATQDAVVQKEKDRLDLPRLKAQLADLEKHFDPNYEYSDDHTFWSNQKDLGNRIRALKHKIHSIGEGDE
jgi:hypothetical protein